MFKKIILLGCLMIMSRAHGAELILDFFGAKGLASSLGLLEQTEFKNIFHNAHKEVKNELLLIDPKELSADRKLRVGMQNTALRLSVITGIVSVVSRLFLFKALWQNGNKFYNDTKEQEMKSKNVLDFVSGNGLIPLLLTTALSQRVSNGFFGISVLWETINNVAQKID